MKAPDQKVSRQTGASLTAEDFASMANARSGMYDFLAGLCTKPSGMMVSTLLGQLPNLPAGSSLSPEMRTSLEALKSCSPNSFGRDEETNLQVEWTRLFRGVAKGYGPLPPYESVYKEGKLQGQTSLSVAKTYADFGVEVSKDSHELPDFIGVEIKFMSTLASKEAAAWRTNKAAALELVGAERTYAKDHLQSWIPRFCTAAEEVAKTDFYRAVLQLMRSIVDWDVLLLGRLEETALNLG